MKSLLLSPHSDDAELFCAFTILREHPHVIVCTESWLQLNRGYQISQETRWQETINASEILGYPLHNLGIRDDTGTEEEMEEALKKFVDRFDMVYAPMLQGGNIHHDMVNRIALKLWGSEKVSQYPTYTRTCLYTVGNKEIIPTEMELKLKNEALMCHASQFEVNRPHFEAVFGRSEWLL
jgi:LmbE family N-acetylglucosaminyl deacetylase